MVLQIVSHNVFSHLPGILEHFADINSLSENQPTIFHPSLIEKIQQTFLLSLCVPLFQPFHSSQIDGVLKYNDSMIGLHKMCQNSNELSV